MKDKNNPYIDHVKAYISSEERSKIPREDFGLPEEEAYPADTQEHFNSAVHLIGHAPKEKQGELKSRLLKIARRHGWKLPKTWEDEQK